MEQREFVISSHKQADLECRRREIEELFNVTVSFTSDPSTVSRTGNSWLRINGLSKENTVMAEEYVKSLCNAEYESILNITRSFHDDLISNSANNLNKFQRISGAVIVTLSETELLIQGTRNAVKRAEEVLSEAKNKSKISTAALEYAKKLGYSDEEILQALLNCGRNVSENALLQELLILSAKKNLSIANNDNAESGREHNSIENEITSTENYEKVTRDTKVGGMERENGDGLENGTRNIVIDGSNVAMCHGNKSVFSCLGIKICVNWFRNRGHQDITVFVPQWRKEACTSENPITNQEILFELEREKVVVFTPSRRVNGRRVICYDDRYIVKLAAITDGVIVSNDNFRDLSKENPAWKQVVDQQLLMYSFVNNMFMPPDDPQGRHGPSLDDFLKKGSLSQPKPCPYGKRCTYGQKCRFSHPERQHKTLNIDDESEKSFSCPPSATASPNLSEPTQPRRHSYSKPTPYSSCATEYNNARFFPPCVNNDILARGAANQHHANMIRNQSNPSNSTNDQSTLQDSSIQSSPTFSYYSGSEQHSSHYIPGMQGSPMVFYPNLYDPHVSQQFIPNQPAYMPAAYHYPPRQQYSNPLPHRSPQNYPIHGNQFVMQEQQQQQFFPQDGIACAVPPNLLNRMELGVHSRSSTTGTDITTDESSAIKLFEHLEEIFPNKRETILKVMKTHPQETDVSVLAQYILS